MVLISLLLYAPEVQIVIAADSGTYDVSSDITQGSCTLVENGIHSISFTLLNRGRRYDRLFKPNDVFTLYLKRLSKLLIMTGYLDTVPFFSVWPRSVQITGSSTLKSLQYRFWEPGDYASYQLLTNDNSTTTSPSGQQTGVSAYNDDGLGMMAVDLATKVGGWSANNIHISSLPTKWVDDTTTLFNTISPALAADAVASMGSVISGGAGSPLQQGVTTLQPILAGAPAGTDYPKSLLQAVGYVDPSAANSFVPSPGSYYCQAQWSYQLADGSTPVGGNANAGIAKKFLAEQKLMVVNPDTNAAVVVQPVSWGPSTPQDPNAGSEIGLSTDAGSEIGLSTDALIAVGVSDSGAVQVAWVTDASLSLGPFSPPAQTAVTQVTGSITNPSSVPGGGISSIAQAPNSDVAVAFALAQVGKPYQLGGTGPNSFDCSGLCQAAWEKAGVSIPRVTYDQYPALTPIPSPSSNWTSGDLLFYNDGIGEQPGHVVMYIGDDQVVEAPDTGHSIYSHSITPDGGAGFMGARRVTPSYASAHGSGQTQTLAQATAGASTVSSNDASGNASSATSSPIDIQNNLSQYDLLSISLTGFRKMLNDTPLLPMFQTIINGSMRSFCNAPNGDIIAWFPDYFNKYGCLGVIEVQDIELQDFTISWSDTSLVTHQFVAGTSSPQGNILSAGTVGGQVQFQNIVATDGVATIDFPQILQSLFNITNDDPTFSTEAIYQRFGARVNYQGIGTLVSNLAEFWYALYLFQRNWSSMFSASIPIAFMPEAYPGMIMQVPSVKFQCYLQQVTHSWDLDDGGGFTTTVNVVAPSSTSSAGLWGFAQGS